MDGHVTTEDRRTCDYSEIDGHETTVKWTDMRLQWNGRTCVYNEMDGHVSTAGRDDL